MLDVEDVSIDIGVYMSRAEGVGVEESIILMHWPSILLSSDDIWSIDIRKKLIMQTLKMKEHFGIEKYICN